MLLFVLFILDELLEINGIVMIMVPIHGPEVFIHGAILPDQVSLEHFNELMVGFIGRQVFDPLLSEEEIDVLGELDQLGEESNGGEIILLVLQETVHLEAETLLQLVQGMHVLHQ